MAKYKRVVKRCFYCGNSLSRKNQTIDHFIPLSKGGKDKKHNKVKACNVCNTEKGCLLPDEFRAVIAYRSNKDNEGFFVPFYGEQSVDRMF